MAVLETNARNAAADAVAALCNSGDIRFETSGDNEVALCAFGATAFGAAATGVATANAISDDTSAAGGTIDHAYLRTTGSTPIMKATCTATSGGGDFELSSLVIGAGDTVSVTSLTLTQPAS